MQSINLNSPFPLFDIATAAIGNSLIYALPPRAVQITWQSFFGTNPASVTLQLQASNDGTNWSTIDTTTNISGEIRTVITSALFIRARQNAISGGAGVSVLINARDSVNPFDQDLNIADIPNFAGLVSLGDITAKKFVVTDLNVGLQIAGTAEIAGIMLPSGGQLYFAPGGAISNDGTAAVLINNTWKFLDTGGIIVSADDPYIETVADHLNITTPHQINSGDISATGYKVGATAGINQSVVIPGVGTLTFTKGILTAFVPV